ncbi:MAG: hypothetical protein ACK55Z_22400, partial [bacterium]
PAHRHRAAAWQGGLRGDPPGADERAVLRAAVREQGPGRVGRRQERRTGGRTCRGERRRAAADRLRHQPLRLPDEEVPARAVAGARRGRSAARPGAAPRADCAQRRDHRTA